MIFRIIILLLGILNADLGHAHFCYSCNPKYYYPRNVPHDVCMSMNVPSQLINITCHNMTKEDISRGAKHACYKVTRTSTAYENETYIYERGCTTKGGVRDFCDEIVSKEPEVECELCYGNNCNDANDMQIIRCLMFFLAVFLVLYMRDQAERNQLRDNKPLRW